MSNFKNLIFSPVNESSLWTGAIVQSADDVLLLPASADSNSRSAKIKQAVVADSSGDPNPVELVMIYPAWGATNSYLCPASNGPRLYANREQSSFEPLFLGKEYETFLLASFRYILLFRAKTVF